MSTAPRPEGKPLVLNVDDNEPARYAKGRVLTEHGFQVVEAANGRDALELAGRHHPDVILLDVGLPGMDGLEVCRRLKSEPATRGIPVVQTSASFVQDSDRVRALEGGADAYLIAPTDPRVLVATVNAMLRLREAESALRASESRFRTMADAAPVLIWVADVHGATTWLNRRWLEFTGWPADAAPDVGRWSCVHPDDVARCREQAENALARREELRIEYRLRHHDGTWRWVLDQGAPLYDGDRFTGFIGSCVDTTDQRTTEEKRRSLFEAERHARAESERLNRVKDEFLATLSHELRTPLNAILGWSQVVLAGGATDDEMLEAIRRIERNARSQARIIEDLLDMSRIISGKVRLALRNVDLATIAAAAVDAVAPTAAERGVRIVTNGLRDAGTILADADRIQQVLWNLLNNAIKFSQPQGVVRIDVRVAGDFVECDVTDEGVGIEPQFLPHVFERFRQADPTATRSHGGLGLGLAIVQNLVELHGGSASAFSRGRGHGARFRIRLPLSPERVRDADPRVDTARREAPAVAAAAERADLGGARILVVDDDVDARELLQRILETHGAVVTMASSAQAGIAAFEDAKPDLVISDIGMPGLDGYEFIRRIRGLEVPEGEHVPAMALTAFARHEDREQALRAGFQRHLVKPILAEPLLATTRQLLGRK